MGSPHHLLSFVGPGIGSLGFELGCLSQRLHLPNSELCYLQLLGHLPSKALCACLGGGGAIFYALQHIGGLMYEIEERRALCL